MHGTVGQIAHGGERRSLRACLRRPLEQEYDRFLVLRLRKAASRRAFPIFVEVVYIEPEQTARLGAPCARAINAEPFRLALALILQFVAGTKINLAANERFIHSQASCLCRYAHTMGACTRYSSVVPQ